MSFLETIQNRVKYNTSRGSSADDPEQNILIQKGDILHLLLLLLLFLYSVTFTIINLVSATRLEALLTSIPVAFIVLEYVLYMRGYSILSKSLNMFQVTAVVGLLSMISTPGTGILAFYIPILLGTQLTFWGKERIYAHVFTIYILALLAFFLTTDLKLIEPVPLTPDEMSREWFMNFFGAALASSFEIIFILSVSNHIQESLFLRSNQLNEQNKELERALVENQKNNRLITSQLDTIHASQQELAKLSTIATKTQSGVIICDAKGQVQWINESFTRISGYTLEDIIGKKPGSFLQLEGPEHPAVGQMRAALARREFVEVTLPNRRKNGEVYMNQLEINPIFNESGELINFVSLQWDITEEAQRKNEITRINERFDRITTQSGIGIWVWETSSNQIFWNDILKEQLEVDARTPESELYALWIDSIHPEDRSRVLAANDRLVKGQESYNKQEYRIVTRKTERIRYHQSLTLAERDVSGNLIQLMGSTLDITEQKDLQLSIIHKNNELEKANSELDKFVYSVSHDLRSPLLSIKGLLGLSTSALPADSKVGEYLSMAQKSITRLDETIKEILEYSRNSRLDVSDTHFDLRNVLEQVYDDLRYIPESEIEFRTDIQGSSLMYSDRARIHTLLRNLIGNAVKYRRTDGTLAFVTFSLRRSKGQFVIEIADNGEGIAEESLPKIFDMFYRGSSTGTGTGLGLYICRQITDKLNGTIGVSSKKGSGTTFTVNLPDKENHIA